MNVIRCLALFLILTSAARSESITEIVLRLDQPIADPVRFMPAVTMTSADGHHSATVNAFWDGGTVWRARFRVTQPGAYQWTVDHAKVKQKGEITVRDAAPKNALRVSGDGTHLETASGVPFFWLADTAWNGVLKSTDDEWSRYLNARQSQGFNVIQFVSTPWRGGRSTLKHPPFEFAGDRVVSVDPKSLQSMDAKIRRINDRGMVASPIMLWALNPDDPGEALSEADAIVVAKYLLARWGAYRVVWMLGGDGRYPDKARWNRIGSAVFPDAARNGFMPPLVTTHPSGLSWFGDDFADSDWYDFHGYQSGHGDAEKDLLKHLTGPWTGFPFRNKPDDKAKPRPVINLEPNYEAHPGYQTKQPHSAQHVRRAAYWSVLLGPAAGVTYGHNAVWVWNHADGEVAENHGFRVDAFTAGLETPGVRSMTVMKAFFACGPWWELRHDRDAVAGPASETGDTSKSVDSTIVAATTGDGTWTVLYTPVQQEVRIAERLIRNTDSMIWIDPANGNQRPATVDESGLATPPENHDWVLSIRRNP